MHLQQFLAAFPSAQPDKDLLSNQGQRYGANCSDRLLAFCIATIEWLEALLVPDVDWEVAQSAFLGLNLVSRVGEPFP